MKKAWMIGLAAMLLLFGNIRGVDIAPSTRPLQLLQTVGASAKYLIKLNIMVQNRVTCFQYIVCDLSGRELAKIPSSYSTEFGSLKWATDHAGSAIAYWNPSGHRVAIDEDNFRFRGKVFIINLDSLPSSVLTVPRKSIEDLIGTHLEMYRIRVGQQAWKSDDTISLIIAGHEVSNGGNKDFLREVNCYISKSDQIMLQGQVEAAR